MWTCSTGFDGTPEGAEITKLLINQASADELVELHDRSCNFVCSFDVAFERSVVVTLMLPQVHSVR
jgi:hypothetical protein